MFNLNENSPLPILHIFNPVLFTLLNSHIPIRFIYLLFYVTFNSQGHIATGSLQVEETSAYCTVNHRASASNYQLSNTKCPARDSNRRPQRLEARTLTTTPPSPLYIPIRDNDFRSWNQEVKVILLCMSSSETSAF